MVYKARLLLSGRQKIAIAFLMLIGILVLANYPRIAEALLAFLLGGVVPGTDIIISPDIVLLLVLGVFIVGIAGSIIHMYFKAARGKRNFRIAVQAIESVTVLPVARDTVIEAPAKAGIKASVAVRKRHAFSMFVSASFRKIGHVLTISSGVIGRALSASVSAVAAAMIAAGRGIWKGLSFTVEAAYTLLVLIWFGIEAAVKFVARMSSRSARLLIKAIGTTAIWAARSLYRGWRAALPYFERFDSWLELRMRGLEAGIKAKLHGQDTVRTASGMSREYRKSISDLHPKKALTNARQKASAMKPKVLLVPRGGSRLKG